MAFAAASGRAEGERREVEGREGRGERWGGEGGGRRRETARPVCDRGNETGRTVKRGACVCVRARACVRACDKPVVFLGGGGVVEGGGGVEVVARGRVVVPPGPRVVHEPLRHVARRRIRLPPTRTPPPPSPTAHTHPTPPTHTRPAPAPARPGGHGAGPHGRSGAAGGMARHTVGRRVRASTNGPIAPGLPCNRPSPPGVCCRTSLPSVSAAPGPKRWPGLAPRRATPARPRARRRRSRGRPGRTWRPWGARRRCGWAGRRSRPPAACAAAAAAAAG